MQTLTAYDVDTGKHWLNIVHTLTWLLNSDEDEWLGGIKSTEEVTFELVFTSTQDPQVNVQGDYSGLAYDAGLCTIS